MATSVWVYRLSDDLFLRGGFYDPQYDPAVEGIVEFLDADPHPDVVLDRFDPVAGKRRATAEELAAARWARETLDQTVTLDDVLRVVADELNALRAAVAPPLPALEIPDLRRAAALAARRRER